MDVLLLWFPRIPCAYSRIVIHVLSAVLVCFRETGFSESEIRVGFVTYAKELHFYNVKVINNNNEEIVYQV